VAADSSGRWLIGMVDQPTGRCPACGADNPATQKFCGECGARLALVCPACSHQNPGGQKFCGECGAKLGAPAAPPPAAPVERVPVAPTPVEADTAPAVLRPGSAFREAAPAAYTPKHLAEKILTSRSAIEGERKQVTVMFTDVSGFTAMSERLDPEEVHAIMDRVFEVILGAVHGYEGTINQFLGNGVMALFGAPIAHEDHAGRALRAARGDPGEARAGPRGRPAPARAGLPHAGRHQHWARGGGRHRP
jgi:Double zinc ribbon/Adenylate and Guanylate cyclase catalytic domain